MEKYNQLNFYSFLNVILAFRFPKVLKKVKNNDIVKVVIDCQLFHNKKKKLVEAWISIHEEELESLWTLIHKQGEFFRIEPLK